MDFFWIVFFWGIPFIVTNVTTKSYQEYYWTQKMAKNGPKQPNNPFFCPKVKKSLGQSPPQELEVGPRSGLYLLVFIIRFKFWMRGTIMFVVFIRTTLPIYIVFLIECSYS